ncbi:hypothetical protein AB1L88_11640 [Tautonia sp. JC769]|uniref:ParE family toxin-like protein n=1 Tax=Tautonia sp. JC769 TaxID=3232135 RepID=UPI0034576989
MSTANKNVRTAAYRAMEGKLPPAIRKLAEIVFTTFQRNPDHPALRRHQLDDMAKGRHRSGTWSVSINMKYRALYVVDGDTNVWYWVGSHNDFENFVGRK